MDAEATGVVHPVVIIGGLALAAWAWSRRDQKDAGDVETPRTGPVEHVMLWIESGDTPPDAWLLETDQADAVIDSPHEWKLPEEARGSAVWAVPDKTWPEQWGDFVWIQHPVSKLWFVAQSSLAELLKESPTAEL